MQAGVTGRFLLVGATDSTRRRLRSVLGGIDEQPIGTAEEAVAAVRASHADGIVAEMSGLGPGWPDVVRTLRRTRETSNVCVFLISTRETVDRCKEALEAGADDFILHPFRDEELAVRLRARLALSRSRRTEREYLRAASTGSGSTIPGEWTASSGARAITETGFDGLPLLDVIDAVPDMVWSARPDGFADFFNQRWYEYTGSIRGDCVGDRWIAFIHPNDRDLFRRRLEEAVATGRPYELEARICRAGDKSHRWHLARGSPIRDSQQRVVRWLGTCTDIEEQKRVERQLYRANEHLNLFVRAAGHDLREPLRTIVTFVQLLEKRSGDSGEGREILKYLTAATARLESLLTGLVEFARATQEGPPSLVPVDCETVFEAVVDSLRSRIEEEAAIVMHDPLPVVLAQPSHVTQILQNLIGNAVKYRKLTEPPRVHASAVQLGDEWIFIVRDNGVGFPSEHAERLFTPFKRLDPALGPGAGLGLAISKAIVERYGGRIWAESKEGEGSTFYFTLPRREASDETVA